MFLPQLLKHVGVFFCDCNLCKYRCNPAVCAFRQPQTAEPLKGRDAVKVLYILQKFLESLDADHLWQSGDVPLPGCLQKLLLPPPYRSSLCSCTDQTLFENKGHWSSVMSRKKKKKLQSFHTLQHCNDFIIFCDIFWDLSCSIDYAGTGIIPQQQQNNFLKGPKLRERKKDTVACHHSKNFKRGRRKSVAVIPTDTRAARRKGHQCKQDLSLWCTSWLCFGNALPFAQCRLLCVEVCHPCCSADLHQHLPANVSHWVTFTGFTNMHWTW